MKETPLSAKIAQALILLVAGFWLLFALFSSLGALPGILSAGPARWIMAILALGASAALSFLWFFLRRRSKSAYYALTGLLGLICVLSITDEVGLLDIITLVITLAALLLLVWNRAWYMQPSDQESAPN